ncbi:competence protein ComK [Lysinibacillus piscis]|uniref:Competence protein n=1 Tax=Lysinibacillus piscis TaxID=2518931 RepID=A0ABQ5NI37_9BACI|nr:competence protein ComK [Lysinibacillus sp. KH24]GLC87783.1 competence protein [Lysinibacillus sp. KH24]
MDTEDVMNSETMLYEPVYDEFGNLNTNVIEKDGEYISTMAPTKLMDFNLRYFGSSLKGACEGSKTILGKLNKNPILVYEKLWFPSKSPWHRECAWYAVHHIYDYGIVDKKRTKIIFTNGRERTVDMSVKALEYRMQRAFLLKYKLEIRKKNLLE